MKAKRIDVYRCPQCDEKYEEEDTAQTCCPLDSEEAYKCGECDEIYDDKEDAKECCK